MTLPLPDPLLRAVLEFPDDDGPRLVAADFWDEAGECARAEFVRVQCELAEVEAVEHDCYPDGPWAETACPACGAFGAAEALAVRGRQLWEAGGDADARGWFAGLGLEGFVFSDAPSPDDMTAVVRRGFVEQVACSAALFLGIADALTAAAPVRVVRLTTRPHDGLKARRRWRCGHPDNGWSWEMLLALEFPGVTFELPSPPPARGTATIGGVTVPVESWELQPGPVPMAGLRRHLEEEVRAGVAAAGQDPAGVVIHSITTTPTNRAPAAAWLPGETGRPRPNSRRPDWYDNRRRRGRRRR